MMRVDTIFCLIITCLLLARKFCTVCFVDILYSPPILLFLTLSFFSHLIYRPKWIGALVNRSKTKGLCALFVHSLLLGNPRLLHAVYSIVVEQEKSSPFAKKICYVGSMLGIIGSPIMLYHVYRYHLHFPQSVYIYFGTVAMMMLLPLHERKESACDGEVPRGSKFIGHRLSSIAALKGCTVIGQKEDVKIKAGDCIKGDTVDSISLDDLIPYKVEKLPKLKHFFSLTYLNFLITAQVIDKVYQPGVWIIALYLTFYVAGIGQVRWALPTLHRRLNVAR